MWLQIARKCCIKTNTSIAGCYLRTINLSASSIRVLLTAPPYRGSSQWPRSRLHFRVRPTTARIPPSVALNLPRYSCKYQG